MKNLMPNEHAGILFVTGQKKIQVNFFNVC